MDQYSEIVITLAKFSSAETYRCHGGRSVDILGCRRRDILE